MWGDGERMEGRGGLEMKEEGKGDGRTTWVKKGKVDEVVGKWPRRLPEERGWDDFTALEALNLWGL